MPPPSRSGATGAGPKLWVRRLGPPDSAVLERLARDNGRYGLPGERPSLEPLTAHEARIFLSDERTICLVAFVGEDPVGFLYACELYRRHGQMRHLCLYEVGVAEDYRRRGIGGYLMTALAEHAKAAGIERGFVVTNESNGDAMQLYKQAGAVRGSQDDVVLILRF